MKKTFIIFMNDIPKAVVYNYHRAEEIKEEMSKADYKRYSYAFESLEEYQRVCYWHLHEVEVLT